MSRRGLAKTRARASNQRCLLQVWRRYYLQSLCPVPAPMDDHAPTLIRLLAAPAAPASRPGAILGLLLLTAFVLWIGSLAVRRMQISYGGTES